HLSIDALGSEQGLQLRGVCAFVADIKAMGVAGADRDNAQRRRVDGRACAHQCRDRYGDRSGEPARDGCLQRVDGSQFFPLYLVRGRPNKPLSVGETKAAMPALALSYEG